MGGPLDSPLDIGAGTTAPTAAAPLDRTGFFSNLSAGYEEAQAGPGSTRNRQNAAEARYYDKIIERLTALGEMGTDTIEVRPGGIGYTGPKNIAVNEFGIGQAPIKRPFRNPYTARPDISQDDNPLARLYLGGDTVEKQAIWAAVKRHPDKFKDMPDEAALAALAERDRLSRLVRAQEVTSKAGTAGKIGEFIGNIAGSIMAGDPENVAGAGVGGAASSTVARTVIKRAVTEGGINVLAGATALPGQHADAERLGIEMTTADDVRSLAEQGAIGAAIGVAPTVAHGAGKVAGKVAGTVAANLPAPARDVVGAAALRAGTVKDRALLTEWQRLHQPYSISTAAESVPAPVRQLTPADEAQLRHHWESATPDTAPALFRDGKRIDFDEFAGQTMARQMGGDTATPDEKAAATVLNREIENKEVSPLKPEAEAAHLDRLKAIADDLGVPLRDAPELPSSAPVATPTVRDRSPSAQSRRPASFVDGINAAEGHTRNPRSSADGYGNFIDSTWLSIAPRVTDTTGMTKPQILALRHDKDIAGRATALYAQDNGRYLRQRGIEDSPGNLSLAHFLGPDGAAKVLKADPATPVESILPRAVITANREILEGKSASQVAAWAHKRIGAAVEVPPARPDAVPDEDFDYASVAPYAVENLRPDEVQTDAALMQYKSGGDENGVTDALKGVEAWNPLISQQILVWDGLDGRRIVVDGHQRTGLAKRLFESDPSITLPAVIVREADGITAKQARVLGALRNIANGTGTLEDNARVLRDAPQGARMLPKNVPLARESMGVAKLSYEAFGAVLNNVVDPRIAAQVGIHAAHAPEAHMPILTLLAKEKVRDPAEAAAITRQALADGFGTAEAEQLSLLGAEPVQSLYVPIARILDASAKRLRAEKRTFKVLKENAGRIEAAGNVLDRAANESKVISNDEALAILDATAHSAGPVRDALIAAARAELSGTRRADAVGQFLDALAGIDLRAAARGVGQDGGAGESLGGAGRDLSPEAQDGDFPERSQPSLADQARTNRRVAEPFSDPVGEGAKAQTALLEHDLLMDADPAIAERQRQETQLRVDSPLRPGDIDAEGTMGLSLFDASDEPTFRLSEEGEKPRTIADIMAEAEGDEAAAQAAAACLQPPKAIP